LNRQASTETSSDGYGNKESTSGNIGFTSTPFSCYSAATGGPLGLLLTKNGQTGVVLRNLASSNVAFHTADHERNDPNGVEPLSVDGSSYWKAGNGTWFKSSEGPHSINRTWWGVTSAGY
jgi:hypothetical protein